QPATARPRAAPAGGRQLRGGQPAAGAGGGSITAADTGPGSPGGPEARLFEPFFTTKAAGLGMGLAICRATVTNHGGRLWAERMANTTLMCFTLPLVGRAGAVGGGGGCQWSPADSSSTTIPARGARR